jgi:hypothetical protein
MEVGMFRFEGDFKEALGCLKRIFGMDFSIDCLDGKIEKVLIVPGASIVTRKC